MRYNRIYPESVNMARSSPLPEYMPETHQFNFKLVYTDQIKTYDLNVGISSKNTYLLLADIIREDFGLDDFEIVIGGQIQQELAQNMTSMRMHLHQDYRKSFYVRPRSDNQFVSLNSNNSEVLFELGTCVVCFQENIQIFRHYSCQHMMCTSCNNRWSATETMTNCNRCPECRSE